MLHDKYEVEHKLILMNEYIVEKSSEKDHLWLVIMTR